MAVKPGAETREADPVKHARPSSPPGTTRALVGLHPHSESGLTARWAQAEETGAAAAITDTAGKSGPGRNSRPQADSPPGGSKRCARVISPSPWPGRGSAAGPFLCRTVVPLPGGGPAAYLVPLAAGSRRAGIRVTR